MLDDSQATGEYAGWVASCVSGGRGQADAWLRTRAKAKLRVNVASRALALEVSGVDLLGRCTSLSYTWVPSAATGNSGCLVLQAGGASGACGTGERGETASQVQVLVYKFETAVAGDECYRLLQALSHHQPEQPAAWEAGPTPQAPADAVQQAPVDHDRALAKAAIQRYLLDEEFQEYVAKVEDAWDELEAELALQAG